MTTAKKNSFISLFASVQLALFLLFLLASTSIIGTIIPQNSPPELYIQRFGPKAWQLFQLLDLSDMYNSWWFLGLLALFSLNLIVCSAQRIPRVIDFLRQDYLQLATSRLRAFPLVQEIELQQSQAEVGARVAALLQAEHWPYQQAQRQDELIFFSHKGGWTRFGVYVVHCSILVILAGAVVGSSTVADKLLHRPDFAFKGSIMLPEGQTTTFVLGQKDNAPMDLGFQLRCDDFTIAYYPNGMPRTYRSTVTVLERGKPVKTANIEVNQPLTYKGVTFYQSSYQPFQRYQIVLRKKDGPSTPLTVLPLAKQLDWAEAGVSYGILKWENQGEATRQLKLWFNDNQGEPTLQWIVPEEETTITRPSGTYFVTVHQLYATGLQATKDPGVGLVYGGCLLMLVGLYVAFFLSHRRLFVVILPATAGSCRLLFAGEANKNTVPFEKKFKELISKLHA